MILNIEADYGYVILSAIAVAFECLLIGFFVAGRARSKVFTKDFLEANGFSNT